MDNQVIEIADIKQNLGTRTPKPLRPPQFPNAGEAVRHLKKRPEGAVDVLLVNPPSPDGAIWIRSQHRVGRRSRENMIWPQVSLAQLAAMLYPDYTFEVIDAIAERMTWAEFEYRLRQKSPKYYITQTTAPTLTNDMYGAFLARSLGARTIAFGTHVTPMPYETLRDFPALDFVLRGEPELTFRELIDTLEGREHVPWIANLLQKTDPWWKPQPPITLAPAPAIATETTSNGNNGFHSAPGTPEIHTVDSPETMHRMESIKGLAWRRGSEIIVNIDRPFIPDLDDLPIPLHNLLPFESYRIPMLKGPYTFIVTSRGCPAGCKYCIKHVSYQYSVRLRSPEKIMQELWLLYDMGVHNIHMYADLFTVSRDQVINLCKLVINEGLKIKWTCNSRVDYVDDEMLKLMGQAGCWMISWGIESGNYEILKRAAKGADPAKAERALRTAKHAGIKNWGYFIIGLPGETVDSITQTIAFAKKLPLDVALFHIAAPYPGTPFFFEVVENGWFRAGTRWEEVDMDRSTVLDYENLRAEELEYWQKRAFREWAMRPGPIMTYLKTLNDPQVLKSALEIGLRTARWALLGKEG
ncbi:MAG: radical SAM protein [Chloroflexi bacterium]|nr:radical SAM protein [Chloroflexota bacterium]